ncbi:hypothetical protein evm_005767 [Chilo suppressalis]|nr:hypothetical protein evm_005767 [Chilo suppressalis]
MASGALRNTSKLGLTSLKWPRTMFPQSRAFSAHLTETQCAVQDMTRKFTEEYLKPKAGQLDLNGRFPFEPIKKLTDLGYGSNCI